MDMNNASNLEQNLELLAKKIIELNASREVVKKRKELHRMEMDGWLANVESRERDVKELQNQVAELQTRTGLAHLMNKSNLRNQLNKKVIANLNDVNHLKQIGTANPESICVFLTDLTIGQPRPFSHAEIKMYTPDLSKSIKIKSDQYGDVYKGQFQGKNITVKVLTVDVVEDIFMAEVRTLSNASHRNLVKLYGYCFHPDMKAVVYEYMEKGSFDKLLYRSPNNIKWEKFYHIATETAKGLAYLHEGCDNSIIHYDVKVGNILLDSKYTPKIADFGISKLIENGRSHVTLLTKTRGTLDYVAPEMWGEGSRISCKCDVYSFGMMLFEILRMRLNKEEGQDWFPPQVWDKFKKGQLEDLIKECGIKEENNEKARVLCKVALWCSQFHPVKRPSMSNVVKMLEMQIRVEDPTDPSLRFISQAAI